MIHPTEKDIGRAVVYAPSHGLDVEFGVISSLSSNREYAVFVRFGASQHSFGIATRLEDLDWAD